MTVPVFLSKLRGATRCKKKKKIAKQPVDEKEGDLTVHNAVLK